mmetsp:Transcript_14669/g.46125  ORF Transcript_14669/g.46125 Transcript_14669/m.46125 type:complete len:258 (-) Transcript_14669:1024-1797(-)
MRNNTLPPWLAAELNRQKVLLLATLKPPPMDDTRRCTPSHSRRGVRRATRHPKQLGSRHPSAAAKACRPRRMELCVLCLRFLRLSKGPRLRCRRSEYARHKHSPTSGNCYLSPVPTTLGGRLEMRWKSLGAFALLETRSGLREVCFVVLKTLCASLFRALSRVSMTRHQKLSPWACVEARHLWFATQLAAPPTLLRASLATSRVRPLTWRLTASIGDARRARTTAEECSRDRAARTPLSSRALQMALIRRWAALSTE